MIPLEITRQRVVIEAVTPEVQHGRFAIKRVQGEVVVVEADVFADGHDTLRCLLLHRPGEQESWTEVPMEPLVNDRWWGRFTVQRPGWHLYTIRAWVDPFGSFCQNLGKKVAAGVEVATDLLTGARLLERASRRAPEPDRTWLVRRALELRSDLPPEQRAELALDEELAGLMERHTERQHTTTYDRELRVWVDRPRARFSAWYEMFPRSCSPVPGRHGTLQDCIQRLPYVASLGFDVLYLPPVHPIGRTQRKGPNNRTACRPGDPGSPWAIGATEGGHKAIHTQLGTLQDFHSLLAAAGEHGLEVALDVAFQCSPDHPWIIEHPDWFRWRPDGTVQYAENPPKKYEDIFPLNFESEDGAALWEELRSVFLFWIEQGVRIFRVDNPHTKPFVFWEWCIGSIRERHPDVIFLSEAFTRPKVMYELAKLGFTQSYTYFAWRNERWELEQYFTELSQSEVREFFRPNLWPNTPDILTEIMQTGGRLAFMSRLVLAATLGANYGIYGPAFELCVNVPREPGSEEYLDAEKYEIKSWDLQQPDSLGPLIGQVNRIRRDNPALQADWNLDFHPTDNEQLIVYSKHTESRDNVILVAVNLDPHHEQSGFTQLELERLGLPPERPFTVCDLLNGSTYTWQGPRNYIQLGPVEHQAHIFRVEPLLSP